ncbi:hypothetical protein BDW59DRAFT_179741 [Aspergillus cavernicola]|uniref:Arabinosidase n=1 Tax=Aspergillus cavernicola TaxID=176166 RepID=A0ABR4IDB4_9EURO
MHLPLLTTTTTTALLTLTTAATLPRQDPGSDPAYVGYLLSTFTDVNPQVYWYLSDASDPLAFNPLNGGEPVLRSTVGTQGVRDIFLTTNAERSEFFVVATDLDINADGFSWDEVTRRGSRGLTIWKSNNLIDWSEPTLSIYRIEDSTAGMAWAPSVLYNSTENLYYLFWASRLYSDSDTEHTGTASLDRIRYATTSDFVTFSQPSDYVALDSENIPLIDQEFLSLGEEGHYARFLKDENVLHVYQETTTDGLFGGWTRVPGYIVETVTEGPAAFPDIQTEGKYHLLLDNYVEYVPFQTSDIESGAWVEESGSEVKGFPAGLKHGNVVLLTAEEYEAVLARFG